MNEIKVEVKFKTQELIVEADKQLITGDYATSKLVFSFDDDYSAYRLVFGMKNPAEEVVLVKDIGEDNEIVLVAYDEEGNECSVFGEAGRYIFEVSRYGDGNRLTSAFGCIYVEREQVRLGDKVFTPYIPLIDQLFTEVEELKEAVEGATSDTSDCVQKTDVLSSIDGSNYEETEKPVNTQAVINYVAEEIGNMGDEKDAVLYTEQTLTEEQKVQARENIDAVGSTAKTTKTFHPTAEQVTNGYIMADGTLKTSTTYCRTEPIAIDFDANSIVNVRCTINGNVSLLFLDESKNVLLGINSTNATEYGISSSSSLQVVSVTLPEGAAYVRMCGTKANATIIYTNPEDLYITGEKTVSVLELLNAEAISYAKKSDALYGKKLACVGDSLTEAVNPNGGYFINYAELVALRHDMEVYKDGRGGTTMCNVDGHHPFCWDDRYKAVPSDFDILTIWFGWNDAYYGTLGTISDTEDTTFYGAYKKVLDYLITTYPTKKIGLIVPYGNVLVDSFKVAVRELSEMYGVPCLDLADGKQCSLLWGMDNDAQLTRRAALTYDGTHPNQAGHEYLSTMYEEFIKRL